MKKKENKSFNRIKDRIVIFLLFATFGMSAQQVIPMDKNGNLYKRDLFRSQIYGIRGYARKLAQAKADSIWHMRDTLQNGYKYRHVNEQKLIRKEMAYIKGVQKIKEDSLHNNFNVLKNGKSSTEEKMIKTEMALQISQRKMNSERRIDSLENISKALRVKNRYNYHLIRSKFRDQENKLSNETRYLNKFEMDSLEKAVDSLDLLEDRVFIYGFGSSDAVNLDAITANGGFSFGAQLHPAHRIFLSIGIGGNVVKKEKRDSVNINSIFFPDNASSVVCGHYEWSLGTERRLWKYKKAKASPVIVGNAVDDFLGFAECSLQSRNIEAPDSSILNFGIINLAGGFKYRWTYNKGAKNRFSADIGACFNYVELAKQSKKSFQALVDPDLTTTKMVPTIYRGISIIATVQYNDLIIYARFFSPLSVNGALRYEHNVYFSTGIKVTGTFFSF